METYIYYTCLALLIALAILLVACRATPAPGPTVPAPSTAIPAEKTPVAPSATVPTSQDLRRADGAGQWYPDQPEKLRGMIDLYLDQAEADLAAGHAPTVTHPVAILVPHAGYVFSGWVAAYAYAVLKGESYDTAVIIGDAHAGLGRAAVSIWARGAWETPLGISPINQTVAEAVLAADPRFEFDRNGFTSEHPVENQLPFIQRVLGEVPIVPIVIRQPSPELSRSLAQALVQALKGHNAIIVASTDLAHWPSYEVARRSDGAVLEALTTGDPEALLKAIADQMAKGPEELHTCMCSQGAVLTALYAAPQLGGHQITVLKYGNSGDTPFGDRDQVVGYAAVAWSAGLGEGRYTLPPLPQPPTPPPPLNEEEQRYLLQLARHTLENYLSLGAVPQVTVTDAELWQVSGAFVTLKKNGELRGCVGNIIGQSPLYLTVQSMAIAAATEDQRFLPVSRAELDECEIEISVLSPLQPVAGPEAIEIGKHGVVLVKGNRHAVYLPQVATEQGWDRETMLANLSRKAGLSEDAWRDPQTEFYVFTAQVFAETNDSP